MEFFKPSVFYYLLLLAIPVIIHLFNFRRHKKISFSNNYFLKKIAEKTKAIYQIRRWIILATRILATSSVILAFALPYLKEKKPTIDANRISIYIDNSFSMSRKDNDNIQLIDHAKKNAQNITAKLKATQKVLLLTNDFNKKYQKWYNPKEAYDLINEIDISGNKPELNTILNRYHQIIDTSDVNTLYLFSDFQKDYSQLRNMVKNQKTTMKIGLLQSEKNNNISIDSCYFSKPIRQKNEIEHLIINLTNHGTETQIVKGKLLINNQQKSIQKIEIPGESTIKHSFHYSNPSNTNTIIGSLHIDHSHIKFDNELHFAYSTEEKIQVCAIYNDTINENLLSIFSDSLFNFNTYQLGQVAFEKLNNYELIILDQLSNLTESIKEQLYQFVQNNGNLMIFLKEDVSIDSYNTFFKQLNTDFLSKWIQKKQNVESINYDNDIFRSVFKQKLKNINLPIVNNYFQINPNQKAQKRNILNLINNDPFLSEYKYGKGRVFICFSDLNMKNNSFSEHALFVPFLYNAALLNLKNRPLYHVLKNETIIEINEISKNDILHLKQKNHFDMMPSISTSHQKTLINFQNKIELSGHYQLIKNTTDTMAIAFNYNRKESEMYFWNKEEIQKMLSNDNLIFLELTQNTISKKYQENKQQKSIENFFILLAIILLIIELLLLRIWKI